MLYGFNILREKHHVINYTVVNDRNIICALASLAWYLSHRVCVLADVVTVPGAVAGWEL